MTKPYKILIVEDDPDTAEMLRAYFETQGYQVLTTAWGNEAIEVCRDTVPDLIIEDIRLPDIDGYQVVHELRKHTRTSNVPIIFLTERQARDDKIAGLRLGAVAYLSKPFDMQELHLCVRNALRRASYTSLVSPVTGLPVRQITEEWLRQIIRHIGTPVERICFRIMWCFSLPTFTRNLIGGRNLLSCSTGPSPPPRAFQTMTAGGWAASTTFMEIACADLVDMRNPKPGYSKRTKCLPRC